MHARHVLLLLIVAQGGLFCYLFGCKQKKKPNQKIHYRLIFSFSPVYESISPYALQLD